MNIFVYDPHYLHSLLVSKRYFEAEKYVRNALTRHDSGTADLYHNLGATLNHQRRFREAEEAYGKALAMDPDNSFYWTSLGINSHQGGDYSVSEKACRKALELDPTNTSAMFLLSELLLLQGDAEGWGYWEARRTIWEKRVNPRYSGTRWWSEPLEGRTLLVHCEQGLGDTLQFLRYCKPLADLGATVIVEVQEPLVQLVSRVAGVSRVITRQEEVPKYDYQIPMMSVVLHFLKTVEEATLPETIPYLVPAKASNSYWSFYLKRRIKVRGERLVGICWRGAGGEGILGQRDIPIELLLGLSDIPGIRLVNLQKELGFVKTTKLVTFEGYDESPFLDSTAIIANLDLVITCDTVIAHLAGGLGIPVWILVPYVPDWRWFLDRTDSPWYPTARLFRQESLEGGWDSTLLKVREALCAYW